MSETAESARTSAPEGAGAASGSGGEDEEYLVIEDVQSSAWPTSHALGDLHVVPEGLFFLPRVTGLRALLEDRAVLAQLGLGGALLLRMMSSKPGMDAETWRAALAGKPLDALVRVLPDAWWVQPEQIRNMRRTVSGVVVQVAGGGRRTLSNVGREHWSALQAFAQAQGWPVERPWWRDAERRGSVFAAALVWLALPLIVFGSLLIGRSASVLLDLAVGGLLWGLAGAMIWAAVARMDRAAASRHLVWAGLLLCGGALMTRLVGGVEIAPWPPIVPRSAPVEFSASLMFAWGLALFGVGFLLRRGKLLQKRSRPAWTMRP